MSVCSGISSCNVWAGEGGDMSLWVGQAALLDAGDPLFRVSNSSLDGLLFSMEGFT